MENVLDFLRRNADLIWKIAVGAAALSILFPLVQAYYSWIAGEDAFSDAPSLTFWISGNYFFDPLVAAIVLGALLRDWRATYVAIGGLAAQLLLITGILIFEDLPVGDIGSAARGDQLGISEFQAWLQTYLTLSLRWVWTFGLIAFGVAIGRKLGDLFAELRPSS